VLAFTDAYATVDTTDDAIAHLGTMPEPWFLMVGYNAAHTPFHDPPEDLHPCSPGSGEGPADQMDAMVESLDTEIGRLLDAVDPDVRTRTTVIVLGDNGTTGEAIRPPWPQDHKKGTMMESSVRVPMIVTGPLVGVPGSVSDAFVHVVDVFPTAAALARVPLDDGIVRDGTSLVPMLADASAPGPREYLFTEKFNPNGDVAAAVRSLAVRDRVHKLVILEGLPDQLFDLRTDRWSEGPNLLDAPLAPEAAIAERRLRAELDRITGGL
jgi:arylsulfatase A-like enzyme